MALTERPPRVAKISAWAGGKGVLMDGVVTPKLAEAALARMVVVLGTTLANPGAAESRLAVNGPAEYA